ncbi:serine hydrolase domain-containing protein [Rufibacter hautae]|uniref:Serine hydrolase n=1 Tax=Rufibacter hautae TaxID=2595005 RepID=A0A5B6TKX8_9BACT|nr:serine hydrolase domain-containing protein [Rufibacter hautae]KAA3440055.1 serine hydrolase [Rufibacter hautae]
MDKKLITLAFLLCYCWGLHAQPAPAAKEIRQVENNLIPFVPVNGFAGWNLHERMKHYRVPGLSIAVIKDFKIAWAKGYGLADTLKKTPVTTQTMFSAGSISKLVMAAAALRLVQDGKLALDAPINQYLTSWKIPENDFTRKTPITLRMLLSHTGGTTQSSYFGFTPDKKPMPTIVDILSGTAVAESRPVVVNSEPAKEFRYSGGGSIIAQLALMDVSKMDFASLVKKTVFDPLGMQHSTFAQPLPLEFSAKAAWAYSSAPWFKGMPYVYPQQAAAGLYTTPTDLARFFIDLQNGYRGKGKLLQQTLAQQMFTPQVTVSEGFYKEQMGLGPFLLQRTDNQENKGIYFEFTGVNAGFLAYGIASLTEGYGVVIMLNSGDDVNGLGKEIRRAVAKTYGWYHFLPEAITPLALSTAELDQFTGRYRRGPDEVVYLRREKNYLVENVNEGADIYTFPVTKDTLIFTDFNIKGFVRRDVTGHVASLQTAWQDKPMPRMKADEFTPSEHLKAQRFAEAKEGFRQLKMNESQLTYLAYELLNKPTPALAAAKAILEVALEQHPTSAMVQARFGDYFAKMNDKPNAIRSYSKALELDPSDLQAKEKLSQLKKEP